MNAFFDDNNIRIPNEVSPYFPPLGFDANSKQDLVAVGGTLKPDLLVEAYSKGLFPWYEEDEPILWHSPEPRLVLPLRQQKIPKSLAKLMRQGRFCATWNMDFDAVIDACARTKRVGQEGTWIHPEMEDAYKTLHVEGIAHSVEVFFDGEMVGGLYGLVVGSAFFGESMFHAIPNASKVAFAVLIQKALEVGIGFIDCQTTHAQHLRVFGAVECSKVEFHSLLRRSNQRQIPGRLLLPNNNPNGIGMGVADQSQARLLC